MPWLAAFGFIVRRLVDGNMNRLNRALELSAFATLSLTACAELAPLIGRGLPPALAEARPAFDQRVKERFPIGSDEAAMRAELRREGFAFRSVSEIHARMPRNFSFWLRDPLAGSRARPHGQFGGAVIPERFWEFQETMDTPAPDWVWPIRLTNIGGLRDTPVGWRLGR